MNTKVKSVIQPENPGHIDYTWSTRDGVGTIKGGQLSDEQDVCYIADGAQVMTPDEAIALGIDLLRWAQFIKDGAEEKARQKYEDSLSDSEWVDLDQMPPRQAD